MNIEYDILTTVSFKHRYFSDLKFSGLQVVPDNDSTHTMINHGLVFKSSRDGFRIFFDSGDGKQKAEVINSNITLRFVLTLTDPLFYNYTSDFTKNLASGICYFHNIPGKRQEASSDFALHTGDFVSEKDVMNVTDFDKDYFTKPFGVIDLAITEALLDEYSISFHEKETYWRYVLVSDHLKHLTDPAVVYETELFDGPKKIALPDKREAVTFESTSPIGIFQLPKKIFKLVENYDAATLKYKVVLNTLPLPDVNTLSVLPREKGKETFNYSEIFIY